MFSSFSRIFLTFLTSIIPSKLGWSPSITAINCDQKESTNSQLFARLHLNKESLSMLLRIQSFKLTPTTTYQKRSLYMECKDQTNRQLESLKKFLKKISKFSTEINLYTCKDSPIILRYHGSMKRVTKVKKNFNQNKKLIS